MSNSVYLRAIYKGLSRILLQAAVLALLCAGLTTLGGTVLAQQGAFVPTGNLNTSRGGHTATLLNNGKVLIAGGGDDINPTRLATAELYDPTTGTFTVTGSMNSARSGPTATLLNNGMVLIAGGVDNTLSALATAELYDPTTGTFTFTGSMSTARWAHTATLLNNGTVLVAGGQGSTSNIQAAAELYNPATGTFTPTGSLNFARSNPTATLLNNGMVLFAGGFEYIGGIAGNLTPLGTAELYDPTAGTFSLTGSLNTARTYHAATLLNNGTVLVAGGETSEGPTFGGATIQISSAEVYDPTIGTFRFTGSMSTARNIPTATLLNNGTVLITGGSFDGAGALASAEFYDPTTETFTLTGSMSTARYFQTATPFNNETVLVAGGSSGSLPSAELYELVVVSPARLFFCCPVLGTTSSPQTVTLTNNYSSTLDIIGIALSGTNASYFTDTDINCLGRVLAGASCSINVTFTPSALGSRTGSLNIANNLSGSPVLVPLTGTGDLPTRIAGLSASSLTFTNQMVGLTSPAQGITLSNTGNLALTISGVAFSGTNASEFAETDNCAGRVAAGASCTISVTFSPAGTGTRIATLGITDDATSPPSPQTVALTGTGIPSAPIVSLSSMNVVFPNQTLNTSSAPQTLTLHNMGAAILNIQAIALAGANPGDFAIAGGSTCTSGANVAPNASCVFQLTFAPVGLGTRSATMGITDNASDSPETISVSGTTTPTPLVLVSPSNISFPSQYVGTSGLPQSVTLTNNGNAPLSITSVTTSATDFGTLNACGSTVAASSSCAIGVFFDPTTSGTRPGTLTINDNAPGSPHTLALNGTGQDFSLAPVTPASASVAAGQTANYTVVVSPAGGFNQTVTLTCTGMPALSTCTVTPNAVPLNGTVATNVAVSVTTAAGLPPLNIPFPRVNYRLLKPIAELLVLSLLVGLLGRGRERPRFAYGLALLVVLCAAAMMSACGGGNTVTNMNHGTPSGTYSLVVSGNFTSGSTSLTHSANLTLVVQ